jgi:putative membrane protein
MNDGNAGKSESRRDEGARGHTSPDPLRGAIAGLVAGLVASLAMDLAQKGLSKIQSSDDSDHDEPATEKAADRVAEGVTGAPVSEANKALAGQAVHYGFGALLGLGYGIAAEYRPGITAGAGAGFGLATAALFDEIGVPAAGLGDAPWKADMGTHLYTLASHLVFGTTTEVVRRVIADVIQETDD